MPPVVPKKIADEHSREIPARNRGGPAGAHDTHRGGTPFAVEENPVEEGVDDIGADESESDGLGNVHGLQATANGEIQEEGEESKGERLHVREGKGRDLRVDVQPPKKRIEEPNRSHQERRHDHAEVNAVD